MATKRVKECPDERAARQEMCGSARGLRVLTWLLMGVLGFDVPGGRQTKFAPQ